MVEMMQFLSVFAKGLPLMGVTSADLAAGGIDSILVL